MRTAWRSAVILIAMIAVAAPAIAADAPPPEAKPTDPCSALHAAEYIATTVPRAWIDVGDTAVGCGRAYLAMAPQYAGRLFLEAGDAYAKAATYSLQLAQNTQGPHAPKPTDATIYWSLAFRSYSLAAQLNITGAAALATKALAHIPEPR